MSLRTALQAAYHRLVPLALRRRLRLTRFTASRRARARLWTRTGGRVAAGVFQGQRLAAAAPDDVFGAALLGAYECETHAWLERELARGWPAAVDVGSDTGYYSTGLAQRLPGAVVHAFEMDDARRAESGESARRNGVSERVVLHGLASPETLAALPVDGALVVCDCEGAERELMDPARVPWLARSALLIELHEFLVPGVTELLRGRFSATHDITIATQSSRDPVAWARAANVPAADAAILAEEVRLTEGTHVPGRWMQLTPRSRA